MTSLENELKIKKICRFCLNQDEKLLTNLYSRENRLNNSAPLPLQVMACVSIEVFTNDGMPNTVCDVCRMLMEHCYRFKQMCKKADTALRQYPLTGIWPSKLDHPKVPEQLVNLLHPDTFDLDESQLKSLEYTLASSPEKSEKPKLQNTGRASNTPKQKLLNKNPVKILNKEAAPTIEPVFKKPVIKHSKEGTVEFVTEIIDAENFKEIDPVKTAEPVETNVFPCPHCDRSFPLRQLLDIHMVNHNRERNFQCEDCDKKFFTKYDLGKHALIHSNEKPFKCVVCEKSFTRATLLLRHEKIHTDVPKFLCVHCEKPFISKEVLEKHTERHNKKRPFPCKICKASFAFKQGLERHESVHAKEQPFPCQYCNLSFPTPSKLSRHLTAHAGARPYPCKICSKAYLLSHHLTRHLRSHREGAVSFKCYDCGKSLVSRDSLIYHSAVHATQNLLCPICKEQFDDIDAVTDHIKMHAVGEQYACEYCDLIFMTQTKLEDHCNVDHAEEMAVYAELDKPNIKNESVSQEESGDIIQEFVIEEYDMNLLNEDQIIKEEIVIENNFAQELIDTKERKRKPKHNEQKTTTKNFNKRNYSQNDFNLDDFTEEESVLFEELIQEPPDKIFINENEEQNEFETHKPKIQVKRNSKPKMKQTTLTSIVDNVSKNTMLKKDKNSKQSVIEIAECETSDNNPKREKSLASTTQRTNKILNRSNEKINISEKSELPKTIKVGDKQIQVKQINLTKLQEKSVSDQRKINYNKDGKLILKQDSNKNKINRSQ